ncbi:MAG: MBOAT family O-acyltransferase [Pseudomonadota bacterium]
MLFNSFSFLFLFLPVTLACFFLCARRSGGAAAGVLALASLVFYGWSSLSYLPLLLASILCNYGAGLRIAHAQGARRRRWLHAALAANLALLGYFKYADFFIASVNAASGAAWPVLGLVLPVGISFFTFTQIAFLADTYRGAAREPRLLHYLLFVTYFPHLIAGPVLHHKEMMPQFARAATYRPTARNLAVGLSIIAIGLAKKLFLADSLAPHASFFFSQSEPPTLLVAWGGVMAYAFQLYFDFSAYSDMAIGVSRLFGIGLPLNFNSPYKAASVIEFWRRWHMTLSRFLRDYVYLPLGGNRRGPARRHVNLMLTMLLGGLWHGAGWNFVIWGALHGAYLLINHAWIGVAARLRFPRAAPAWHCAGVALTFGAVCLAWVFFRAPDLARALLIVRGMGGGFGLALPESLGRAFGGARPLLEQAGFDFYLGGGSRFVQTWGAVTLAALVAFAMPNTQQIMTRYAPALDYRPTPAGPTPAGRARLAALRWRPNRPWAAWIGVLLTACVLSLNRPAEFLYFQF